MAATPNMHLLLTALWSALANPLESGPMKQLNVVKVNKEMFDFE